MAENYNLGSHVTQIVKGCINGDRRMQEKLYRMTSSRMFGLCLRYAGNYQEAEDILQEGYIKVFNHLKTYRGDGSLDAWMCRIFIHTAIEYYRRRNLLPQQISIEELSTDIPNHAEPNGLQVDDLLRMIQSLAVGYRTVFNLYAVEGYSHQEIAKMLGISVGTSKSQLARARCLLQKMIMEHHEQKSYAVAL